MRACALVGPSVRIHFDLSLLFSAPSRIQCYSSFGLSWNNIGMPQDIICRLDYELLRALSSLRADQVEICIRMLLT